MIDIRDYDQALLLRFQKYYSNTFWINKPAFQTTEVYDNHLFEGKRVTFPLLTLRRVAGPYIYKETNGWAQDRTGLYDPESGIEFVASNYQLTYELDVLSYDRDNFDELLVEVQENLIRHPYLSFDSDDELITGVSVHLDFNEVQDNSDLESFQDKNPLYRATLTLELRAYIYRKYRAIVIEHIPIEYRVHDNDDKNATLITNCIAYFTVSKSSTSMVRDSVYLLYDVNGNYIQSDASKTYIPLRLIDSNGKTIANDLRLGFRAQDLHLEVLTWPTFTSESGVVAIEYKVE